MIATRKRPAKKRVATRSKKRVAKSSTHKKKSSTKQKVKIATRKRSAKKGVATRSKKRVAKASIRKQKTSTKRKVKAAMETLDGGNLEQIRDILFGTQAREFNQGLSRLEERFSKETAALKKDAKNRTDSLELYVKDELQSLIDRVSTEQEERKRSIDTLGKQIKDLEKELRHMLSDLEKRLTKLDEKLSKSDRTLRQHILDEAKNLRDDVDAKHEQQSVALEQEARLLRDQKTDRAALADLFKEMAMRLTGEFDVAQLDTKPE